MERFFGGNPVWVIVRLIIISVIVGIVLAALNLDPQSLLRAIQSLIVRIKEMGFDAVEWAFQYFLLGAVVVIPIWLISRLFSAAKPRPKDDPKPDH